MSVLVVGATGRVGREVVAGLVRRGVEVLAATRDPSRARVLAGARAVALDLDDPTLFAAALVGVDRVFLLSRTGDERADVVGGALLDAMRTAGVRRVVHMTGFGVERADGSPLRRLELHLERSGMDFTHLRPNYFFQNFCVGPLLEGVRGSDEITVPMGSAAVSFVDVRDIAAVAVESLVSEAHRNTALALTGGAAVTHVEIADAIGEARSRPVAYRPRSEEQERASLLEAGTPPDRIERRLGFLAMARSGALATVSPDVERVLGRPPLSLRAFARDHRELWLRNERGTASR